MSPCVGRAMDRKATRRRNQKILAEHLGWSWLKIGTLVDYHATIGGPVTTARLEVREGPEIQPSGQWVVWLKGKAGCVACEAVTPHADGFMRCDCGKGVPAPLEVQNGMRVHCDECGCDWIGVNDAAHGHWLNARTKLLPGERIDFGAKP